MANFSRSSVLLSLLSLLIMSWSTVQIPVIMISTSLCVCVFPLSFSLSLSLSLSPRGSPQWARASSFTRFLDHTQQRTTFGGTLLDEWSAPRRDIYLTTRNIHDRRTPMPPVGFEPTISAGERPQTYASDRAATGAGCLLVCYQKIRRSVYVYFFVTRQP